MSRVEPSAGRRKQLGGKALLAERTARPYRQMGIFDREFVRGKLRHDPLYFGLLKSGVLFGRERVLDLGCGRGIALALMAEARELAGEEGWPEDLGPPPSPVEMVGVENNSRTAEVARVALGDRARVLSVDLVDFEPGGIGASKRDLVLLLDVLHYLGSEEQLRLLDAATRSLEPGGALVLREAGVRPGVRFLLTRAAERLCALCRGHWRQEFFYRSTDDWRSCLERCGLRTEIQPMSEGTPYANDLIVGHKPPTDDHALEEK